MSTTTWLSAPCDWPEEVPADLLGLTYTRHWRLLSAMAVPTDGRISRRLYALGTGDREAIRRPHPDLLEVLDPRATSVLAADLLATIGPTSMLIAETLAAAIHFQSDVYIGDPQSAIGPISDYARILGVNLVVVSPPS